MKILIELIIPILIIIILLFCSAYFASTETAFTALSRIQIKQMLREKNPKAKKVAALKNNMDRLITTVLTGTNLINTLASAISTAVTIKLFGQKYVTYATIIMTILVIVFGEIIPKTTAGAKPSVIALKNSTALCILQKIFFPVVWFFNQITKMLKFCEKKISHKERPLVTEDELKTLLEVGEKEGTLEQDEKRMLDRIFEFSDLHVYDILKHRSLVIMIDVNATWDEVIKLFSTTGYSRIPVYENSTDNIIGILHYKSVLFASKLVIESKDFIRICMRQVLFVPQTLSAIELLLKFKKERSNFAVTVDEYGSSSGIVTMDDVLMAVFGRIIDEYAMNDIAPEKQIKVLGTKEFLVPGEMKLDDLNEVLKLNLDSDDYDTLGGWLLEKFGELPSIGMVYKHSGTIFIVEDQAARRIQSVRIRIA